eukprot:Polyplicarium_translucidae@DN1266_c0_g1_i4.p1
MGSMTGTDFCWKQDRDNPRYDKCTVRLLPGAPLLAVYLDKSGSKECDEFTYLGLPIVERVIRRLVLDYYLKFRSHPTFKFQDWARYCPTVFWNLALIFRGKIEAGVEHICSVRARFIPHGAALNIPRPTVWTRRLDRRADAALPYAADQEALEAMQLNHEWRKADVEDALREQVRRAEVHFRWLWVTLPLEGELRRKRT